MAQHQFQYQENFRLESGVTLPGFHLGYTTFGKLNIQADNVIWVFHALTANSNPEEWWPELIGSNRLFNPDQYFIICVNMPGSCYGSIGPLDENPATGQPWYNDFPFFTTRDMIRTYQLLRKHLGFRKIKAGIGGSMGGQQLLEWAIEEPELFEHIFPIATNAIHSPWGKAFNASQRHAIEMDPTWGNKKEDAGIKGMKVARGIALISYRHYEGYRLSQTDMDETRLEEYRSESYQKYQGEKLSKRFNAYSYYFLSKSMDAHNVGRGRGGVSEALSRIKANTTVIGIESDILFPISEQKFIADHIPGAALHRVHSNYGHDGFLLEFEQLEKIIRPVLIAEVVNPPSLKPKT